MLASELVTRALRLINVPGRGGVLGQFDKQQAFETLQEILDSEAVSKFFVPGIRTHFFDLAQAQHVYTYGPGAQLDTDDFYDPVPIKIEDAYIKAGGASIIRNELVTSWDFLVSTGWTLGTGWTVANGKATKATGDPSETLDQTLALVPGTAYTLRLNIDHREGELKVEVNQDASPIVDQDIIESGEYEFEFTFSGSASDITFTSDAAGETEIDILDASIIETGKDRVELSGFGSDYSVKVIDQKRYNRRFSKGTGGRPYQILFSRNHPLAEIRFDNAGVTGDILVMDVLVDRVAITSLSSQIRMHPDAIKWLRYSLADHEAGAYGKQLSPRQIKILDAAYDKLVAGNLRTNTLSIPRALRSRPIFDINRGDP